MNREIKFLMNREIKFLIKLKQKLIMNREIKFRAWDLDLKQMIYFDISDTIALARLEIMQYTGLKDKNSKEIYEGDILKVNSVIVNRFENERYDSETEFEIFCEVIWCKEIAGFDLKKIDGDREPAAWSFYNENINPFEVIGNIFENPELL